MKNLSTVVRQQDINSKHPKDRKRMTNGCQSQISEENETSKATNTRHEEIFVIESPNAAVEEIIVMITSNDTTFAHLTVEGPCRYIFST